MVKHDLMCSLQEVGRLAGRSRDRVMCIPHGHFYLYNMEVHSVNLTLLMLQQRAQRAQHGQYG